MMIKSVQKYSSSEDDRRSAESRRRALSLLKGSRLASLARTVIFIFIISAQFLFLSQVFADAVYLSSGEILKGVVVEEHCDRIVLSTYKGEIEVLRATIDQIFFDTEEQNYVYLADKAFVDMDFDIASGLYQKASQINPEYLKAEEALVRLNDAIDRKNLNIKPQDSLSKLNEQMGIIIERNKDDIRVKTVSENLGADKAGISPADVITNVWGLSVKYMDAQQAANIMAGAPETFVKITIEKNIFIKAAPLPWFKRFLGFLFFDDFGMKLTLKTSGLVVSSLSAKGTAKDSGIRAKDEIISINGESVRYMPVSMVRRKIFQSNLKTIELTVKRNLIAERN